MRHLKNLHLPLCFYLLFVVIQKYRTVDGKWQVFLRLMQLHQGIKTTQGKSEMLPLYQDKKEQVFR
jgi:hypothetical protein